MDKTLQYYSENAAEYAKSTQDVDMSEILESFIGRLPSGGKILNLGCGSGRDNKILLAQGFDVTAVDGSPAPRRLRSIRFLSA